MHDEGIDSGLRKNRVVAQVDHVAADGALGWACFQMARDKRVTIDVFVDGKNVGSATADSFRPDLRELGISDGNSGFRFDFPDSCFDGATHEVVLREAKTGVPIGGASVTFPERPPTRRAVGVFEHLDPSLLVVGWALDATQPALPVTIDVVVDGNVVVSQETRLVRPDLLSAGLAAGRSGFRINIPKAAITGLTHEVTVLANGAPLEGGPKTLDISGGAALRLAGVKDGYVHVELTGWPGGELPADMLVNGVPAGRVSLRSEKGKDVHVGKWKLPDEFQDGTPHVYQAVVHGRTQVLRSDAVVQCVPDYKVHIDHADFSRISGWALRNDHHRTLKVGVYFEGRLVGEAQTVSSRVDVQTALGLTTALCGFDVVLKEDIQASSAEFELRDQETGIFLANVAVACKYEAMSDLALRLAQTAAPSERGALRAVLAPLVSRSSEEIAFSITTLPQRRPAPKPREIDVIIPVYGGPMETAECIESVLAAKNKTASRVIVVNDCSPDPLIATYLAALERRGRKDLLIIHRTVNGGFSQSVNLGMAVAGGRDVILLNADTVVQDAWIDRLAAAAAQDPRIATVTPLSNNGEICTVPYICKSLPVDDPALAAAVDRAASACNAGRLVDLPVGIGFCLYLRRECIDQIGPFDAATWGRGYGEEVDFCLKAAACGWRNVLAADTFVVHRGNVSFGNEKLQRIIESAKKINERYPFYDHVIQRFLAADPVRPVRRSLNVAMIADALAPKRILHVTHAYGGGTDQYVRDMVDMAATEGIASAIVRFTSDGSIDLSINLAGTALNGFFAKDHTESYGRGEMQALHNDIARLGFDKIHIHAPFGIPEETLRWIASSHRFDVTVHDYAWICPRVTLTGADGRYCGEPSVSQCNACVSLYGAHPELKHFVTAADGDVSAYRAAFAHLFAEAQTVYTGARDVVERLSTHRIVARFKAGPHPAPANSPFRENEPLPLMDASATVKVAMFGAISDIKGFYQLKACAELAEKNRLPIQFIVFGMTMDDDAFGLLSNVKILGKYEDAKLAKLVAHHRPHLAFFPNQWPETFSYTLSHAFRLGLWPVATDIGAPAERIREAGFGTLFPQDASANDIVRILMKTAVELKQRPAGIPNVEYPTTLSSYADASRNEHAPCA